MGIINWQNIPIPQFDATSGARVASEMFQRAAMAAKDTAAQSQAIDAEQKKFLQESADRVLTAKTLGYQNRDAIERDMEDGTHPILDPTLGRQASLEALRLSEGRQDDLLKREAAEYKFDYEQEGNRLQAAGTKNFDSAMKMAVYDREGAFKLVESDPDFQKMRLDDQNKVYAQLINAHIDPSAQLSASLKAQEQKDLNDAAELVIRLEDAGGVPEKQYAIEREYSPRVRIKARATYVQNGLNKDLGEFAGSAPNLGGGIDVPQAVSTSTGGYDDSAGLHHDKTDALAAAKGIKVELNSNSTQEDALKVGEMLLPITVGAKYGAVKNKNGEVEYKGTTATGLLQINNATRRQFAPAALGSNWETAKLNFENDSKIGAEIFRQEKGKGVFNRWVATHAYRGFAGGEAFNGLDFKTQIAPTLALLEGDKWPDPHTDALKVGQSMLQKMEGGLSIGASVLKQIEEQKLTSSQPIELAGVLAKKIGVTEKEGIAAISDRIKEIVKDAKTHRNAKGRLAPIDLTYAEAAGLLANAIQNEKVVNLENFENGLDVNDGDLEAWVASRATAESDFAQYKEFKAIVEGQAQLAQSYTDAKKVAEKARSRALISDDPASGQAFVIAMGRLYKISKAMGDKIDADQAAKDEREALTAKAVKEAQEKWEKEQQRKNAKTSALLGDRRDPSKPGGFMDRPGLLEP